MREKKNKSRRLWCSLWNCPVQMFLRRCGVLSALWEVEGMLGWSMGVNGEELRALWAPDPDGPEPEKCPEMDWDLIYKPLKCFWFARQEIGSRHPLNVCVCACTHTCVSWPSAGSQLHLVSSLQHAHKHACDRGDSMLLRKCDLLTPCCGSWLLLPSVCALGMLSWEGWCVGCLLSLGFGRQERGVGKKCAQNSVPFSLHWFHPREE